ncbi:MAG: alpha-galactosidase [Cellvibrionaceae bacterium]
MTNHISLRSDNTLCLFDCRGVQPRLIYWGEALAGKAFEESMVRLHTRQEAPACASREAPITLCPTLGNGYLGKPALEAHRHGKHWSLNFRVTQVTQSSAKSVTFLSEDCHAGVELRQTLTLDSSGVLSAETEVINRDDEPLCINHCAAACFALPDYLAEVISFDGRWANEFQMQATPLFRGHYSQENRHGRTSHHAFPAAIIQAEQTTESHGRAFGFHLGWSGNHQFHLETLADGRLAAQFGELLLPGEIILQAGQCYQSPTLFGSFSKDGRNKLAQNFHQFVRSNILSNQQQQKPRPVHFNTWEAQYFDHDIHKLLSLADSAANIGAERFVLDDGWFLGRRHDSAGLGDWRVDPEIYPQGLSPLIEQVEDLGMEFGLWLEPEMVNPDSELYRQHPDWVLSCPSAETILARHQLALNLTLPEVQTYLFDCIDTLLQAHPIRYLKWDMNRDLHQPGDQHGGAAVHAQTHALYQLLDRLRRAHPEVEIESCASGGGRADFAILALTDRIWTSDSNDAIDRLNIQKGFSCFFPSEVMGSHVGPSRCHITGRQLDMQTRAGVAIFGHMGMEVDLTLESEADLKVLAAAINLHKKHRALIHGGDYVRLNSDKDSDSFGIVDPHQGEALFSHTLLQSQTSTLPGTLYFEGLNPHKDYQLSLIWPEGFSTTTPSIVDQLNNAEHPIIASGAALQAHGLQLPIANPNTVLIFHLAQQD